MEVNDRTEDDDDDDDPGSGRFSSCLFGQRLPPQFLTSNEKLLVLQKSLYQHLVSL